MSHICSFCGNETAGADPCPWCNGTMGVVAEKPKVQPVIIHEDVRRKPNLWPLYGAILLIFVIAVVLTQKKHNEDMISQATRVEPNYVVSNDSLFQNPVMGTPKLAKTASIGSGELPDLPAKTAAAKAGDDEATVADETEDQVVTPEVRQEAIQLLDVQIASQNDGEGHEIAMGTATINNSSPFEVTNYNLYISGVGGNYRLDPFTGTADNPSPLQIRTIPPYGKITIPVMTDGIYTAGDPGVSKTVSVEATENGVTVSSRVTIN